jgi:uncharacterized protein YfdQ (DUF2303 family)
MEDTQKEAAQVNITPDAAEAAINALGELVAELQEEVKSLKAQAATSASSVQVKAAASDAPLPEADEFSVGGKKYRFALKKFLIDGEVIFAHEAAKAKAVRERIVKDFPGLVQEV